MRLVKCLIYGGSYTSFSAFDLVCQSLCFWRVVRLIRLTLSVGDTCKIDRQLSTEFFFFVFFLNFSVDDIGRCCGELRRVLDEKNHRESPLTCIEPSELGSHCMDYIILRFFFDYLDAWLGVDWCGWFRGFASFFSDALQLFFDSFIFILNYLQLQLTFWPRSSEFFSIMFYPSTWLEMNYQFQVEHFPEIRATIHSYF